MLPHAHAVPKTLRGGSALQYQNVFAARLVGGIEGNSAVQIGAEDLLVALGQLTAERDMTVSEHLAQIDEGRGEIVGRFVKNDRARLMAQRFQIFPSCIAARLQKALEHKAPRIHARKHQCIDERTAPGNGGNGNLRLHAQAHHIRARIGNARRARIGHQCARFAVSQTGDQGFAACALIVLMIADLRLIQAEMGQQLRGDAGILGGNEVRLAQYLHGAFADIGKVADGRGDQIQRPALHAVFLGQTVIQFHGIKSPLSKI